MELWLNAVADVLTITNLSIILFGTLFGIIMGCLPGMSSTMSVAIIIPFTFTMDPASGIILLSAIYCASVYGGSISAILLNTPGTPAGAATVLDGYPLSQQGETGKVLGVSAVASGLGGIISAIILSTTAPFLADQALRFGAAEYFAVAIFGISVVSSLGGKNPIKGLIAGAFGVLIATVGLDPIVGYPRYTMGLPELNGGFSLIPVLIGLFSASQSFMLIKSVGQEKKQTVKDVSSHSRPSFGEIFKLLPNISRSSLIGTFIGIIPGIGGDPAAFVAYNEAVRWSKRPDQFGKGEIGGVAAPEAANNAVTGGALIPLLTLGIPGNTVTAILIGGLLIHGLRPGPMLFEENGDVVYALFFSLMITNILFMAFGLAFTKYFAAVLKVPAVILGPIILMLSIVGAFAIQNSYFDIWVMLAFGVIGYIFRQLNVPTTPIVLAIILGPIAEESFRQALLQSGGELTIFMTRPITAVFLLLAVISFFTPFVRNYIQNNKGKKADTQA
ncbi:tripartite tricarboxylate transporter permease [Salibacterium halotolerans]|uniref:Putative tricarboxylic transport membrane protein n=1 Tax=Salibacterium halotolerans TaxID=1884432 RepID=A0A1I5PDG1_9BACI|nr:tripartite tricarboxylate transporter permease [Salibacterium halotolerans]SFP31526.1 putative tricarboxylic transport membrane protein [Salibacterium halotolerans]